MKIALRILLATASAIVILLALLMFFGISDKPELKLDWVMSQADIVRAKNILREGSKTKPDEIGMLELTAADLNLVGNYLLNRFSKGKAEILLRGNKIRFAVTATLPENRIGKYVNISFRLGHEDSDPLPTLTKFKAGKLLLPSRVAAFVIKSTIKYTSLNQYFLLATDPIKAVDIGDDKIAITYNPSRTTLTTARDLLTHDTSEQQVNVYQSQLAEIVSKHDPDWRLSLAELLQPLFALALQRSTQDTASAENRAVIFTVNDYVNKQSSKPITPYYPAYMYKRIDLAQHFIGAAAITASVNGQIAQAFGEEKELRDSQVGTGFSFVDLSADKAGTRFGELATASPATARRLQEKMAKVKDYTAFMPDPGQLPEHMDEAAFKQRYGSINSPAYLKVAKQIEDLIAATPVLQE